MLFIRTLFLAAVVSALPQPGIKARAPQDGINKKVLAEVQATANKIIPVVVGGTQDTFVPNVVRAAIGDVIQFQFSNGNHTVTQSAEDAACQPLQATVATAIHSGHIPFVDGQTTVGTFNMPITAADTMFLYCATGPHCQEGQVMVINPTSDEQIVNYAKLAAGAAANVDGTTVVGGSVGSIPLESAAFTPAAPEEQGPPPAADPAAADPAATTPAVDPAITASATLPATLAEASNPGDVFTTTTVVVTVTA
ncbi:hypothetical protein B0O99DRAFT_599338 [Bisporella sp. PMI_857]|nr:hypothetical protein B0O99DRAFT_599338 [Bisporella sp. PMI_857]